jgi:type II secretory pathway pseudopilin PulG
MRTTSQQAQRGFSIIEALVSLGLLLFLLTAAMSVYAPSRQLYTRGERRTDVQQNARLAMAELSRQIRMAGYFPENFTDPPASPELTNPILLATNDFLAIHADADGSDASNSFGFCLDGNVLRRVRADADDDAAYVCGGGDILAERVSTLRFTYYDENGDPIPDPPELPFELDDQDPGAVPDLTVTTQRDSIRRVVVALAVESETAGVVQTYHLTSDVWLRNVGGMGT